MNKSEKKCYHLTKLLFCSDWKWHIAVFASSCQGGGGGCMWGQATVEGAGPPWVNPHYLPMSWPGHISQHYPPTPLPFLLPTTTMMMLMLMSVSYSLLSLSKGEARKKYLTHPSAPLRKKMRGKIFVLPWPLPLGPCNQKTLVKTNQSKQG